MPTSRFTFDWANDENTLIASLTVCYSYTKPYPARTQCDPDDGWEAGGGLDEWTLGKIEVTSVNGGDVGTPCGSPQADEWDKILVDAAKKYIELLSDRPSTGVNISAGLRFKEQIEDAIAEREESLASLTDNT